MWMRNGEDFYFSENKHIWNAVVNYMNDEIREMVAEELAPCSEDVFIRRYLELAPDFEYLLGEEFGIEWV